MANRFPLLLPRHWKRAIRLGLLHAVGLERQALAAVRADYDNSSNPQARILVELERMRELLALREEEIRIKDARIHAIPARERPYYPPTERMAILLLRAKAGWNACEAARRFLVTPATIAAWMKRLEELGAEALVQTKAPINRFPEFVTTLVQNLHSAAPGKGRRKLAEILARLGLHLAPSTVERMRKRPICRDQWSLAPESKSESIPAQTPGKPIRRVTARYPHHVWHTDLTTVSTGMGFWVPWWPFAIPGRWFLSWHVALVMDHFSRALIAFAVFKKEPTAMEICAFLGRAVAKAKRAPRHMISDRGMQFRGGYRKWCRRNGVKPRFGALGHHGSIALMERFIRTLKDDFLGRIPIPFGWELMRAEMTAYAIWYNEHRPHASLGGATPSEMLEGAAPACHGIRIETRPGFPLARGEPAIRWIRGKMRLQIAWFRGHRHLPVFALREAG